MACHSIRRPQISLSNEVQAGPPSALAGYSTPGGSGTRTNIDTMQTGTPSFRTSGVVLQAGDRPSSKGSLTESIRPEVKTDGCEVAPPVLPSPTNSQRQPMMPRSFRSVRSAVHGANWGPEVSSALATSIPMRAPQRPGFGYQKPVLEMNVEDLPCIPQPSLETPTYSQRQPMMSRSNRSMRNQVMTAADAETIPAVSPPSVTPTAATASTAPAPIPPTPTAPTTIHAGATPKPRGLKIAALETDLDTTGTFKLSGMITPTNLDRKNAQMSLEMGTPSFRGSATPTLQRLSALPVSSGTRTSG